MFAFCVILVQTLAVEGRYQRYYERFVCQNLHGVLVPKRESCTDFYVCVNGKPIPKTCGPDYHFNRHTNVCDIPSRADCISYGPLVIEPEQPFEDLYPVLPPLPYIPKPQNPMEVMPDPTAKWHCIGRQTGEVMRAHDSCSHFFVCIHQSTYRRTCPIGMHFNPVRMLCQDAALAGCIAPPLPEVTTDELKISHLCERIADGVFLPHTRDCNKFIACSHHQAIEMTCPKGLHFNVPRRRCEWPRDAQCQKSSIVAYN